MVAESEDSCDDEEAHARRYCMKQFASRDRPRGVTGWKLEQCIRGQMSERCGGNKVEWRGGQHE